MPASPSMFRRAVTSGAFEDRFGAKPRHIFHRQQLGPQSCRNPPKLSEQSPFLIVGVIRSSAEGREGPAWRTAREQTDGPRGIELREIAHSEISYIAPNKSCATVRSERELGDRIKINAGRNGNTGSL